MNQAQALKSALAGDCPRCGARTLFRSWLGFADRCRACGLDFTSFNVGDGPAAFLIFIVGTLTVRIVLSVLLFVLLFVAWRAGMLTPHATGN